MRKHDRRGHQFRRLVAGIAEHQALVAGALFGSLLAVSSTGIHALRNVGRLLGDDVGDENFIRMKNVVIIHVTNLAHGIANDLHVIEFCLGGNFASNDYDVALGIGLTRHATVAILRETGIEDGIRNRVANFIGLAFGDGFG